MARADRGRHPANVDGPWFVDEACIDCDVVRQIAPALFGREDRQSVVVRQPDTPDELEQMWLAALACPTNSVRRDPPLSRPRGLYPHQLGDGVWFAGHNHRASFGANAFLVERPWGRALVDGPRWHPDVVGFLEERGGLDHVLLTHRDDVGDAQRYAEHFGVRTWIHHADRDAAPWADAVVDGLEDVTVEDGLVLVPCPGHTRGSVLYLLDDDVLFSGDSLYWRRSRQDLDVHVSATWYSLDVQLDALERFNEAHRFACVLAGHGDRHRTDAGDMHARLAALVRRRRRTADDPARGTGSP